MKRTWTKETAIAYLKRDGGDVTITNVSIRFGRLSGLKACSAVDYLKNHCNFV